MTTVKTELKIKMVLDPQAKPMTPDIICRTLLGKSAATFERELILYGNAYLDEQIELMKGGANNAK